jgi:hypothetical protein
MMSSHRFTMISVLVLGILALSHQARAQDAASSDNQRAAHGYIPTRDTTHTLYLYAADFDSIDSPIYYKIDPSSGEVVDTLDNIPRVSDASGVAVVGSKMYYIVGGDSNVYKYNLATHTDEGLAFDTGLGAVGPSTIAFDGANFWIGGGFASNKAYLYSPTGTLLKTLTLSACTSGCQGFEYVVMHGGAFLIANEDDGFGSPSYYDIYDLNGNLVRAHFITVTGGGNTGIAWDGNHFWTADTFALSISEWDANGNFVQTTLVTGWTVWPPYLTDMSFDYAQTLARAAWRHR